VARALADRDLKAAEAAGLDKSRVKLLEFVEYCVKYPWRITDELVEGLRQVGFSDEQVYEAALNSALFLVFATMADVYGLGDEGFRLSHVREGVTDEDEIIMCDHKEWEKAGAVHQPEFKPGA